MADLGFVRFAYEGCFAVDENLEKHPYGLPQMICTYYIFGRKGETLPQGFDFKPLANGETKPGKRTGLLFYATGDDMTSVLWPKGKSPAYVLPARYDIFIDFASRDEAYADFFHDAALPGNHTWRLPADAKAIILDAAARSR